MNLRVFVLILATLYQLDAYGLICPACGKQTLPLCHGPGGAPCKCGCVNKDGGQSGKCPCPGEKCDACKLKEEQVRQRAAMEARRAELRKQIADIQAQLRALSATGGKPMLQSKLTQAKAIMTQITTSSNLDASAKSSLLIQARAKIAEIEAKLTGLDAQQAELLAKIRALEAELNATLSK